MSASVEKHDDGLCSEPTCAAPVFHYRVLTGDKRRFKACSAGRCAYHCRMRCGADFDTGRRRTKKGRRS